MISRSLLLVLLVLTCLQSFTTANNGNTPEKCCFNFQTKPISVNHITGYEETGHHCTNHGVIFTLKDGRPVCANPSVDWVKDRMQKIDQRLTPSTTQRLTNGNTPENCCFNFQTKPISVNHIKGYEETELQCIKFGVVFTLKDGRHVCANPSVDWVKDRMQKIDQRLFEQA